jgi:hypothetical protein
MRRAVSVLCCLIVFTQVLVGVPLAVCFVFLFLLQQGILGPISIEVRGGMEGQHVSVIHAPSCPGMTCPATAAGEYSAMDAGILETRQRNGSLLSGSVLANDSAAGFEDGDFLVALRHVSGQETAACHWEQCQSIPEVACECINECASACEGAAKPLLGLPCAN